MGHSVENLVWDDLQAGGKFRVIRMDGHAKDELRLSKSTAMPITNCQVNDLLAMVFNKSTQLARMSKDGPLVDFAGPGRRFYQVTVGKDHSMNFNGMKTLLLAEGYLEQHMKDQYRVIEDVERKLELNWVVPYERKSDWETKKPKKFLVKDHKPPKRTGVREVNGALKKYVEQYVMIIDAKKSDTGSSRAGTTNAAPIVCFNLVRVRIILTVCQQLVLGATRAFLRKLLHRQQRMLVG